MLAQKKEALNISTGHNNILQWIKLLQSCTSKKFCKLLAKCQTHIKAAPFNISVGPLEQVKCVT